MAVSIQILADLKTVFYLNYCESISHNYKFFALLLNSNFYQSWKKGFWKRFWKRRKCCPLGFYPFPILFSILLRTKLAIWAVEILFPSKETHRPQLGIRSFITQLLTTLKNKPFKNIVGREKMQHFLHFPQCFLSLKEFSVLSYSYSVIFRCFQFGLI